MVVNPGELRETIQIQEFATVVDQNGFEIKDFVTVGTLRAKVKTQGTKEFLQANKETTKITIHIICRNRSYLNSDNFVFYKNNRYDIKHIHILEGKQFLQLTCEVTE